jgi:glutaredoxin 3
MKAVIWSKTTCPHCVQAKALMDNYNISYEERILGEDWTADQLFEQCDAENIPRPRSAPQIWLDDNYIGGHDNLIDYLDQTYSGSTEGKL